jgi:ribosomal protein S18 acetylase RimI-like enzyme
MNFSIRQATIDDAHAICQLLAEGGKLHAQALPTLLKPPETSTTESFVSGILQDGESHILVAEVHRQVIGYLHFNHREEKEHPVLVPRSYVSVSSLIVKEQHRHQGIGKALMQRVHDWAEEHNVDDIELQVYEFNTPAMGFYEKLGYQTISRRMKRSE